MEKISFGSGDPWSSHNEILPSSSVRTPSSSSMSSSTHTVFVSGPVSTEASSM